MKTISFITYSAMLTICGCASHSVEIADTDPGATTAVKGGAPRPAPLLAIEALDISGSTSTKLKDGKSKRDHMEAVLWEFGSRLAGEEVDYRLYVFGNTTKIVTPNVPSTEDELSSIIESNGGTTDPVDGTDYGTALLTFAEAAEASSAREVEILVAGDGQMDYHDPVHMRLYYKAAALLTSNPRLRWLCIYGVTSDGATELENVFKGLGVKLRIYSIEQDPFNR